MIQPKISDGLRDQWRRYILLKLGAPTIRVELTQAQLDMAIDEALRRFAQWVDWNHKLTIVGVNPGQEWIDLHEVVGEYIGVEDVIYNPDQNTQVFNNWFAFIGASFNFGWGNYYVNAPYTTMVDYTIWVNYYEQWRRKIGEEPTWELIGDRIFLHPAPREAVPVGIIYQAPWEESMIHRDEWIKEWALAEAKEVLGRIRSKFGSFPGPRGDLSLDGETLISEAREDKERLLERLNEYVRPMPILTG